MKIKPDTGDFTLQPGQEKEFPVGLANYLYSYDQTDLVLIELINGNKEDPHVVERLEILSDRVFNKFRVTNISAAANTIRFFWGTGKAAPAADRAAVSIEDGVTIDIGNQPTVTVDDVVPIDVNMVNGSITVNTSVPNKLSPLDDLIATAVPQILAAADPDSLEVILSINDDETGSIRFGDGSITPTRGACLGPGMSQVVSLSNANLYVIRSGADDVRVSCTLLERI